MTSSHNNSFLSISSDDTVQIIVVGSEWCMMVFLYCIVCNKIYGTKSKDEK